MNTAVIKTGGKQYIVQEGSLISIEIQSDKEYKEGDAISFGEVLLMDDGAKVQLGTPTVKAEVSGTVVTAGRAKKVIVERFKNKTRYHKKNGHRQPFLKVRVEKVA
jgi:large subunit ribosomal protein L21